MNRDLLDDVKGAKHRHSWSAHVTMIEHTTSGCEETHRACKHCPIIRVTVHPPHGLPYRMWQYPDGGQADGLTPRCEPVGEVVGQ